jgi:hypothetical protein
MQETKSIASSAASVLDVLEPDQLVSAKQTPLPRRRLTGMETFMLWLLRFYLVAAMGILLYQVLKR